MGFEASTSFLVASEHLFRSRNRIALIVQKVFNFDNSFDICFGINPLP